VVTKKTLLVGEVGLSHEGSLGMAMSMAKACKDAKLDYVKFQYHQPEFESTKNESFRVNVFPQDLTRYDYWNRTSFSEQEWKMLIEYCKKIEIGFLCTPFSVWASERLLNFGIQEVKISSGDANNWELLEHAKKKFRKIIVSIGMSTKSEVQNLLDFMNDYRGDLLIMQCTSSYPVKPKQVGLVYFKELQKLVGKVGLSDHTGNLFVSIAAIANQASMVEFHVVFSKDQFGPDSSSSITFNDALLISEFRDLYLNLFDPQYDKDLAAKNLFDVRKKFGRGLALKKSLRKGEVVSTDMFILKKPLGPLTWKDREELIGKYAVRDLDSTHHLNKKDFQ
jgi:N,N'-diacetyllegionaminate synthase